MKNIYVEDVLYLSIEEYFIFEHWRSFIFLSIEEVSYFCESKNIYIEEALYFLVSLYTKEYFIYEHWRIFYIWRSFIFLYMKNIYIWASLYTKEYLYFCTQRIIYIEGFLCWSIFEHEDVLYWASKNIYIENVLYWALKNIYIFKHWRIFIFEHFCTPKNIYIDNVSCLSIE